MNISAENLTIQRRCPSAEVLPVDFNGKLFHRLVDYTTVYLDGRVVFTFRSGAEVSTEI